MIHELQIFFKLQRKVINVSEVIRGDACRKSIFPFMNILKRNCYIFMYLKRIHKIENLHQLEYTYFA